MIFKPKEEHYYFHSSSETTVNHGPKTIIEKRAPTDDSIRLAKEYEEKAWERAKLAITKDLPNIEAKVLIDHDIMRMQYNGLVKLNGKRIDFDLPHDFTDREMYQAASKAIADQILIMLLTGRNYRGH